MIIQITGHDIEAFTEGSCYQLALAVQEVTRWPVYAFWDRDSRDYDLHAFVKTPRGTFLDINGEHSRYAMFCDWVDYDFEDYGIRRVRKDYNLRRWDLGNPHFDSMPRARELVPALLSEYEGRG